MLVDNSSIFINRLIEAIETDHLIARPRLRDIVVAEGSQPELRALPALPPGRPTEGHLNLNTALNKEAVHVRPLPGYPQA
jgi:hypothetical protein